jgi:OOP family OmpA-OmpF porin
MRSSWIATTLVLALATGSAHAADNGFYLGAGAVQSNIDGFEQDQFDFDDTGWKIIAGFRPLDIFAVEAEYMDLGSESASLGGLGTASADVNTAAAFGILFLPLFPIDLYAKAGLARWDVEGGVVSSFGDASFDDSGTEFAYGAGIQARFGSLGVRGEYEAFDVDDTDGVELFSLSVTWTFL